MESVPSPEDTDDPRVHHGTHVLRDAADDDRFRWRRAIRANPTSLFVYRVVVALTGLLLMAGSVVTGPIPGPGGIPMFLLGLAVLASEFEWAHRHLLRAKRLAHRYTEFSRRQKATFWCVLLVVVWACSYLSLVVVGVPPWVPPWTSRLLDRIPGVS